MPWRRCSSPSVAARIVSVGFTEHDTVLALGEQPYAVWPWARELLGDAKPTVLHNGDGFEYEKIAALKPDLILGPNSGMKRGDYQDGLNTDFLTMLGFEINPKLTPLVENPGEQVAVSEERMDVLDADVIVFATEKPEDLTELKKVPTFGQLGAVEDRRAVYTDGTLAGAIYFMTPLSMEYVLERLTPRLEAAVAGRAPQTVGAAG